MSRWVAVAVLACVALAARADESVVVTSPQANAVSVTIYRDFFALITETREIDLPATPVTLVFEDVVESLLPQSAVMFGANRPIVEGNYRFDPLTATALVKRSVGETVLLTRTNRATGRVTQEPATIVAANDGVVLKLAGGNEVLHCSGLPERLVFSHIPENLTVKPTLSVQLAAGTPGRRTIKLSYIAGGFSWSSNYVGRLNEASDRMQLTGWVTLENFTHARFHDAEVQVVAGKLNLISAEEGGSKAIEGLEYMDEEERAEVKANYAETLRETRLDASGADSSIYGCFAVSIPVSTRERYPAAAADRMFKRGVTSPELQEVVVTAAKIVQREAFADYQLYRIPWKTDLDAQQTKQVAFLSKPAVKVERYYGYRLGYLEESPGEGEPQANVMLRWENTTAAGLGEPLPSGRVRFFEPYGATEVFAGEAQVEDKSVGLPVELAIGRALNIDLSVKTVNQDRGLRSGRRSVEVDAQLNIANSKSQPIVFEFRHALGGAWTDGHVSHSSRHAGKKYGDYAWRFTVQPEAREDLTYSLSALSEYQEDR